jgi:HK97 family phage prohead protease
MANGLKTATALITKAPGSAGTFVLSSTALDRDQDTITIDALRSAAAKAGNLLCLWQHDRHQPIGYWEKLRVEGTKLLGDLRLASTNLGQMVTSLLTDDVPLASSIGFMGSGRPNDFGGITYNAIELLECSVVSVPANPQAVRIAKNFGLDLSSMAMPNGAVSCPAASQEAIHAAKRAVARTNLFLRTRT